MTTQGGPRLTRPMISILTVVLDAPVAEFHGFDLVKRTKLKSGTLYPALARLERLGWLESRWEEIDPAAAGRPRRRLYRLTGRGERSARRLIDELYAELDRGRGVDRPVGDAPDWGASPGAARA